MALIKKAPVNNSANQNYGAMVAFEDPRSSSTYYYFYNEAHDKTTFAPIMNKYLINTTLGGPGFNIGNCYYYGQGVETNINKAIRYWEKGSINGCAKCNMALYNYYHNKCNEYLKKVNNFSFF